MGGLQAGGSKLVHLCALAMSGLVLAITLLVWHTLDEQDRTMGRAQLTGVVMGQLERLLRGLNEVVVTEGAKPSRDLVETTLGDLSALRSQLDGERLGRSGEIDWIDLSPRVSAFVKLEHIGPDNPEAMRQLAKLNVEIGQLQRILEAEESSQIYAAMRARHLTRKLLMGACGGVLLGTALIFALLHRRVTRPLRFAIEAASAYARGDLTHKLDTRGAGEVIALMVSLEAMRTELAELVQQVSGSTTSVATAAASVRASSESLTRRIQAEAGGVEETAASMRVFADTLQQTSADTQRAKDLTDESAQAARQAAGIVTKAVAVMDGIGADTRKIREISSMIDELAFQTNLLALNASIESARSGEAGRGFAVVANEVRVLAQRSAAASGQIKQLIVTAAESVDQGIDLVHSAGDSMLRIADGSARVAQLISSVALHATEQAACVEQIKSTVIALDQSTHANLLQVQDAAHVATVLSSQSERLREQVGRFVLP